MGSKRKARASAPDKATSRSAAGTAVATLGVSRLGAIGKETVLSRGKRKRGEKHLKRSQKADFIAAELARREEEAVMRRAALAAAKGPAGPGLAGMVGLGDALVQDNGKVEEVKERPKGKIVHEKARRKIMVEEGRQVESVVMHPAFRADPMEALRQHLVNSVGEDPLAVPAALPVSANRKKKENVKERRVAGLGAKAGTKRDGGNGKAKAKSEGDSRRRGIKAASAAKARSGRIEKGKRANDREARGRIGEPRPKIK